MSLELRQFETFYWIVRLGGFHAAAARLNLTQPTISARIKELERSLGVRLFDRNGRNVRLSAVGAVVLDRVEKVLLSVDDLRARFRAEDPLRGLLRLGAPDSFALMCLSELLSVLERTHPELKVAVTVDNAMALAQRLEDGALDLAYIVHARSYPRLQAEPLGAQEITFVASPRLELPHRTLTPRDLAQHHIFTNPAPSNLSSVLTSWFRGSGLSPARLSTCNSLPVIANLIAEGVGISLLPDGIVEERVAHGALRRLRVRPQLPRQRMFAAYRKGGRTRAIAEIIGATRDVLSRSRLLTVVSAAN